MSGPSARSARRSGCSDTTSGTDRPGSSAFAPGWLRADGWRGGSAPFESPAFRASAVATGGQGRGSRMPHRCARGAAVHRYGRHQHRAARPARRPGGGPQAPQRRGAGPRGRDALRPLQRISGTLMRPAVEEHGDSTSRPEEEYGSEPSALPHQVARSRHPLVFAAVLPQVGVNLLPPESILLAEERDHLVDRPGAFRRALLDPSVGLLGVLNA